MRAVIQRVSRAKVTVEGSVVGDIGKGLLVLLGVKKGDSVGDSLYMSEKIAGLRIFEDDKGKMNLSVKDIGGEVLLISQFTLYGDAKKGKRPSFTDAALPHEAEFLYEAVKQEMQKTLNVECGKFGADMQVELVNDGPVTVIVESKA